MFMRFLMILALIFVPAAYAQDAPPPNPNLVHVRLTTSIGAIVLELDKGRAPVTTANFLRYVDQKRFDGITFYRAVKVEGWPDLGFIQGGVQNDPRRVLPPIKHEPTSQTGIAHGVGTISMARYAPGTASGDFFITMGPTPSMDAQPAGEGDIAGFAAFGHVTEGMDVVRQIRDAPTSPTAGDGVMKGQMLMPTIRIISARRAD